MFHPQLTPLPFRESVHPIVRVDSVAKILRSKILPSEISNEEVFHYSIPNVQQVGNGKVEQGESIDSDKWLLTEEAVLISKLNPRKSTICIASKHQLTTVFSTEFVGLSTGNTIDNKYLKYVLDSEPVRQFLSSRTTSATRSHQRVTPHEITALGIPWPNSQTRLSIVRELDHELAEIDEFIDDQTRLLELTDEKFKASISDMVHPAPITDIFDDSVSEIEWNSTLWRRTKLGRVIDINGGQVGPREEPFSSMTLIAPNHIESGTGRLLFTETASEQEADSGKYMVNEGQVIFSKIRPTLMKATIAPEDCLCSADMYGISARGEWLTNEFLMYFFLSKPFETWARLNSDRVAMPKLNRETLAATPIWIPRLNYQIKTIESLNKNFTESSNVKLLTQKAKKITAEKMQITTANKLGN